MTSLEDVAERRHRRGRDEGRKRRRLIQRVALTARMLHGNGINHRDFYLCHFLFDPADGDDDLELHLIDLHRAQVRNRTPRRWRIKDISGLYYSALRASLTRHERLRFVQAYDETGSLRRALGDRSFWSRVERRAHELKRLELSRGYADTSGAAKPVN
jgi:heptose I phosphotransferase